MRKMSEVPLLALESKESKHTMAADQESSQEGDLQPQISNAERLLPVSRVRTIMKSSPDVENISQDALVAVTAATVRGLLSLVVVFVTCFSSWSFSLGL